MAINFVFNPNEYTSQDYTLIPVGDHRARIEEVVEKTFSSGNVGFEVTLSISGYNSKMWFYLVINTADTKQTNQRIGAFFDSFGITNPNLNAYNTWVGKIGAVRVKHETYNDNLSAKVAFCIAKKKQDNLAPWKEMGGSAPAMNSTNIPSDDMDLPFD